VVVEKDEHVVYFYRCMGCGEIRIFVWKTYIPEKCTCHFCGGVMRLVFEARIDDATLRRILWMSRNGLRKGRLIVVGE